MQAVYKAVQNPTYRPTSRQWRRTPLSRYCKLWPQLILCDGVCRQYTPQPLGTVVTVPIWQALQQCHDSPVPGHQGFHKTLELLRKEAYWVNMISDVESYCQQCQKCQQFKLPLPSRAPLTSTPIGKPWKMVFLCQPMVTNVYLLCKTSQKKGRSHSLAESEGHHHHKGTCQFIHYYGNTSHCTL